MCYKKITSKKHLFWLVVFIGFLIAFAIWIAGFNEIQNRLPSHTAPVNTSSPTFTPLSPTLEPLNTPLPSYPSKVFNCIDPTIGMPAPCVMDNSVTCVDISNGHAFRCVDSSGYRSSRLSLAI